LPIANFAFGPRPKIKSAFGNRQLAVS